MLEISSQVEPLTELSISLFDAAGAAVLDHPVSDGGADLVFPLRIAIDGNGRGGLLRAMVWGRRDGADRAFGAASIDIDAPAVVEVELGEPGRDCDGDRVPDQEDRCAEIGDPEQVDSDQDGVGDACVPGLACPANLLANGDFEVDLQGWDEDTVGPLTRVEGAFAGSYAARMCKAATGTQVTIDAEVANAVDQLVPGRRFRLDARMRSGSLPLPSLGLQFQENDPDGAELAKEGLRNLPATADWRLETTDYTSIGTGSVLNVIVQIMDADDGVCVDFDAVCLVEKFDCGP